MCSLFAELGVVHTGKQAEQIFGEIWNDFIILTKFRRLFLKIDQIDFLSSSFDQKKKSLRLP